MTNKKNSFGSKSLREKAEKEAGKNVLTKPFLSEADSLKLIHELEVHQIELEMQNLELLESEERSRKATEKYASLYDFAPMGYFTLDQGCKIKSLNLSGAQMVGRERFLLQNIDFRFFVSTGYKDIFNAFINAVFENDIKQVCKVKLTREDHLSIFVHIEGVVSNEEQDCYLTLMDITKSELAEEKVLKSEMQLRELNATKDKFFSIIAHDLRSPFTAIIGYADLLAEQMDKKDYEGIEEYAEIIRTSSWHAMDFVTNLMEWSRAQTGMMGFNPKIIDITKLINDVLVVINDTAIQKSIDIRVKIVKDFTVSADVSMIKTVLRNLISNALKFTNPGGLIVIEASYSDSVSTVSVADNGIGIQKDTIEKLFRIEESKSTTGTNGEHGTGLGLILCNDFIKKHGGKIWAESDGKKGSRFVFTLPQL